MTSEQPKKFTASVEQLRRMRAWELATAALLTLSLAQLVVLKAFEGVQLDKRELKMFRKLTGCFLKKPNPRGYRVLALQAGRQSGKTTHILAALYLRHMLRDVPRSLNEQLFAQAVGPTREHCRVLLNAVAGMAGALGLACDVVRDEVRFPDLATTFVVRTADKASGRSPRAKIVGGDEVAFLPETAGSPGNAEEVFAGLVPSLATTAGPLVLASTPWTRSGYFNSWISRFHGKPGNAEGVLAVIGESWVLNPSIDKDASKLGLNQARWEREFAAQAVDAAGSPFDTDLVNGARRPGDAGADPVSSIVFSAGYDHSRGAHDNRVVVFGWREEKQTPFGVVAERFHVARVVVWPKRFDPDRQIAELARWCQRYRVRRLPCDSYDFPFVETALKNYGIVAVRRSPSLAENEADAEFVLSLFETGRITIPDDPGLVRELTSDLIVERLPGGRSRVRARNTSSAHDDRWSALCRMLAFARSAPASGDGAVKMDVGVARTEGCVQLRPSFYREQRMANGRVVRVPCAPPMTTLLGRQMARERRAQGILDPEVDLDAEGRVIPIDDAGDPAPLNIPILNAR